MWKVAGVEAPDGSEFESLSGLNVAGVTVSGESAWGEGLREKLMDCRREGDVLLLPLPLVITLAILLSFCRWGLSARAASGPTVRMVLL